MLAVSFHEAAHAWVADRLGDPTARQLGRVTMNPLKHIDPVGSVIVPLFLSLAGGIMFGWAKPVPVQVHLLNKPKRDEALVSVAGPISNLVLALVAAILLRVLLMLPASIETAVEPFKYLAIGLIFINVILAVFNMIPIPPLDGSHVVAFFLPDEAAERFMSIGMYGMILVLVLIIMDPLNIGFWPRVIQPIVVAFMGLFEKIAGIG